MRNLKSAVVTVFAALLTATPVLAVSPNFYGTIVKLPSTVQWYTEGLPTEATYEVTITTTKPNVGAVRFTATTSVDGAAETAPYIRSEGVTCGPLPGTSIECAVGDMGAGSSTRTFFLTFKAPPAGNSIGFAWSAFFDDSSSGASDGDSGTETTGLAAPSPDSFSSWVPQSGAATPLFTGVGCTANGCPATTTDTWTTTVIVPSNSAATTATVAELVSPVTCAPDLLTCSTSTLTIPGTFLDELTIILRRDASTITNGAKIANARIYYQKTDADGNPVGTTDEVLTCTDVTYGTLPQSGKPCIESRTAWPKKSTPKVQVPLESGGDWWFFIRAIDNGKYNQ